MSNDRQRRSARYGAPTSTPTIADGRAGDHCGVAVPDGGSAAAAPQASRSLRSPRPFGAMGVVALILTLVVGGGLASSADRLSGSSRAGDSSLAAPDRESHPSPTTSAEETGETPATSPPSRSDDHADVPAPVAVSDPGPADDSAEAGVAAVDEQSAVVRPRTVDDGPGLRSSTGAPGAGASPSTGPGLPAHHVPAGVAGDCSADVTKVLNEWLRRVPDNSRIDFGVGACYWVEGSVTLTGRTNLVIDGHGSVFKAKRPVSHSSVNRAQWHLDDGKGITLRNMTLLGVNPVAKYDPRYEFDHNVFIRGTRDVTVEHVDGKNAYGDFIAVAHGRLGTIPGGIVIRDVSADTTGRMGVSCVACDGVSVDSSRFDNIGYHVFDLEVEGDDRPARNIRFVNNTIGKHAYAMFSVGTPFQTHNNDVSNIHIVGNTMEQSASALDDCIPSISFLYSKTPVRGVVIERNALVSRTDAIMVRRATDVVIRNNDATLAGSRCEDPVAVRTVAVTSADVRDNRFVGYTTLHRLG